MVQFIFRETSDQAPAVRTQLKTGPKHRRPAKDTPLPVQTLTNAQRAAIIADMAATKPHDRWFEVYRCALKQLECKDAGYRLQGVR